MQSALKHPLETVTKVAFHRVNRLGARSNKTKGLAKFEHHQQKELIKNRVRELKGTKFGLNNTMGTVKISEHYEVHILYRLIHTHTHLISLSSLTLSFFLSFSLFFSVLFSPSLTSLYCQYLFNNFMCFLFVYLFSVFVYMFIYVYNKQGEAIWIGALGNNNILYRIHLYCSEAVSIVMQGLFHDHVKRQLPWKFWDVFFNDVKGNYDAPMMVLRYGVQLSAWILRIYALHVTHIDTQPCKLALFYLFEQHTL